MQIFPSLTGLRFVAALCVAAAHGRSHIDIPEPGFATVAHWISTSAGFGMSPFFVLSGFVIHYNYRSVVSASRDAPSQDHAPT